jgi:hypothetical protein
MVTLEAKAGRRAYVEGAVAAALNERANELPAGAPALEHVDVLAATLPERGARR